MNFTAVGKSGLIRRDDEAARIAELGLAQRRHHRFVASRRRRAAAAAPLIGTPIFAATAA